MPHISSPAQRSQSQQKLGLVLLATAPEVVQNHGQLRMYDERMLQAHTFALTISVITHIKVSQDTSGPQKSLIKARQLY